MWWLDWVGSAIVGYFISEALRIGFRNRRYKRFADTMKGSAIALVSAPFFPALAVLLVAATAANVAVAAIN